jgi:hypothetical protein
MLRSAWLHSTLRELPPACFGALLLHLPACWQRLAFMVESQQEVGCQVMWAVQCRPAEFAAKFPEFAKWRTYGEQAAAVRVSGGVARRAGVGWATARTNTPVFFGCIAFGTLQMCMVDGLHFQDSRVERGQGDWGAQPLFDRIPARWLLCCCRWRPGRQPEGAARQPVVTTITTTSSSSSSSSRRQVPWAWRNLLGRAHSSRSKGCVPTMLLCTHRAAAAVAFLVMAQRTTCMAPPAAAVAAAAAGEGLQTGSEAASKSSS